jgi:hypothetical protein
LVPECRDIAHEPEHYDAYVLREGEVDGQLYNNVTFFELWHGKGNVTDKLIWKECASSVLTCGIINDVMELTDDVFPVKKYMLGAFDEIFIRR